MKKVILLGFFLLSTQAMAYIDLSLNYSYGKVIAGENETYQSISQTYSGVWAWYIWEYTALEFNYSSTQDEITDTSGAEVDLGTDVMHIDETINLVNTTVQGIGIRQALAPRKARILPALSIGYAKQISKGTTKYKYTINDDDVAKEIELDGDKVEQDSTFVALSIRFKFTDLFGITLAGRSVFPSSDSSKAGNNIRYSAGISWLF
jgi:hypothetical protein